MLQSWLFLVPQHPLKEEKHEAEHGELHTVDRQALDEALHGGTCWVAWWEVPRTP